MKNLFKLLSLLTVTGFILTSCEGPMGLPGKDGTNGTDGTDGADGKDVKALCLICHSTANQEAKEAQYETSDKGERSARSGKYCARCHSTEGFKEIVSMGTFNTSNEMLNGSKIGCAACHKHASFEFFGDTISPILRTVAPVYSNLDNFNMTSFAYAKTVSTDYGDVNNLCANCHQARGTRSPIYSDTTKGHPKVTKAKYTEVPYFPIRNISSNENTLVSFRAGTNLDIHEGANQADYLTSKNGYEYTGATYTRNTHHSTSTCTECHFNKYNAVDNTGGHTMKVNLTDPACITCHTISTSRTSTLAAIGAKLTELGDMLVTRKIFTKSGSTYSVLPSHDFYGTLFPTTVSTDSLAVDCARKTIVSTTTGLLEYEAMVSWKPDASYAKRIGRQWKYGELGAAWNFTYVNTVATAANKAVHNPVYAMQLLQSSIDWLTANP